MSKKVQKVGRVGLGMMTFGTSELAIRGAQKLLGGPKVPGSMKEAVSEVPRPEDVEESVDERRRRLSILRGGLPQNTLQFFSKTPNLRKKTLLGG